MVLQKLDLEYLKELIRRNIEDSDIIYLVQDTVRCCADYTKGLIHKTIINDINVVGSEDGILKNQIEIENNLNIMRASMLASFRTLGRYIAQVDEGFVLGLDDMTDEEVCSLAVTFVCTLSNDEINKGKF